MTLTPEQIAAGWIEHDGGGCPEDAVAEVMFRDSSIWRASDKRIWSRAPGQADPERLEWLHLSRGGIGVTDYWDIIAYRPERSNG